MTTSSDATFKRDYQTHQKHPQLKGLQPKTIEAYSRAIHYIGDWFDYQLRDLTEEELLEYFSALLKNYRGQASRFTV